MQAPDPNSSHHHALRQEAQRLETSNRWNRRLTVYAWLLFVIVTAFFMSEWSGRLHQWLEGVASLSSGS